MTKSLLYIVIFLSACLSLAGQCEIQGGLKPIPNLSSMILQQYAPKSGHNYGEFYANSVELQPFTLTLCGKRTIDPKTNKATYTKVDPSVIGNIYISADDNVALDQEIDPNNRIPIIQGDPKNTDIYAPSPDEPKFSYSDSQKRRGLLIYTESSHYYQIYKNFGYYFGEIADNPRSFYASNTMIRTPKSPFSSTFVGVGDDSNDCFPTEDIPAGVGETIIHLYLLATKALQNTPLLKISALAKDDSGNNVSEGPLTYQIPLSPVVTNDDYTTTDEKQGVSSLLNPSQFFSYFTKLENSNNTQYIQEERGRIACSILAGAPFHGIYYYTDNRSVCHASSPPEHASDCNEGNCARILNITSIQSSKIPLNDMESTALLTGDACPHKTGAFVGGIITKPILNSADTIVNDQSDAFYVSYKGGVGTYFYKRQNNRDDYENLVNVKNYGGLSNHFYFMSYTFGITPSPGGACKWEKSINASGHDKFGNQINIAFIPANGDDDAKILNVTSN